MMGTKKGPCQDCGTYDRLARVSETLDVYVCEDCYHAYVTCDCCEEKAHQDDTRKDVNGKPVCVACQDEAYKECLSCEELFHEDDLFNDDYGNEYCEPCKIEGHGRWKEQEEAEWGDIEFERRYR